MKWLASSVVLFAATALAMPYHPTAWAALALPAALCAAIAGFKGEPK